MKKNALILAALITAVSLYPENSNTRILVVNSYHQGYVWTDQLMEGLLDEIDRPDREIFVEYLDTKRFEQRLMFENQKQILKLKYREPRPDIIITADDNAFSFIKEVYAELFDGIPVVFCGLNYYEPEMLMGYPLFTGIVENLDIRATVDLMIRLHPGTRNIFILADDSVTGKSFIHSAKNELADYGSDIRFIYNPTAHMKLDELLSYLEQLPRRSLVLMTAVFQDREKNYIPVDQSIPLITRHASVPVYGLLEFGLGFGIVGGKLNSARTQGREAGRIAERVLSGEQPGAIPVEEKNLNRYMFDYRLLKANGIRRSQLPAESIVIGSPYETLVRYRRIVIPAIFVLLIQTVLIIILVLNAVRRRQAEKLLSESRSNLSFTLNSIAEGVIATDTEGKIVRMNPAAEQLTGLRFTDLAGRIIWEVLPLEDAETAARIASPVARMLADRGNTLLTESAVLTARDGSRKIIRNSTSIIRDGDGSIRGAVTVFYDMTERKELERRLIRSQKMEAIGQLAGGVAHDFNNLLAGIMAYAGLLRETDPDTPEFARYLTSIIDVTKRAGGITRQLLEYSRQSEWDSVPLSLHGVINDAFDILSHTSEESIRIGFDLRAVPDLIYGDAARLEQVFLNIGMNARDAMPGGGTVTVLTRVVKLPPDSSKEFEDLTAGDYIAVSIRDSGKGIPREIIGKIFDPFFTTKETGKGTGLGLASAYGIVKAHSGHISVTSSPGLGTEFTVYLPACGDALRESPVLPEENSVHS